MTRIIFTVINDITYDQRMDRICSSLGKNGFDVLLVGRKLKSSSPLPTDHEHHFFYTHKLKRLNMIFTKGKFFYIEYNIRLFCWLLLQKFDIVCGIDLDTILPCYFVSKIKKKKCVYDAHELFSEVPEVIKRPVIQKFWKRVEKFSVTRIHSCYTVSESVAEYFFLNYRRKFEVIRNLPLVHRRHQRLLMDQDKPKHILYQGALNRGRGLEQMILATIQVPLQLKLVGEGDLSIQLRKLVAQLNLKEKVIFSGRVNPNDLDHAFTSRAFIGINLLENTSLNYYYSLANKFFDYVNCDVPQITMNFPEYKRMNEQFEVAVLIDDLNTETLVNAVNRMLHEKDFYIRLRENCLKAREEWNWQKEEPKLLSFYRQLK